MHVNNTPQNIGSFVKKMFAKDDTFSFLQAKSGLRDSYPRVLYASPYWDEKEIKAIIESVVCGKWFSDGENVLRFEREFAKFLGHKYAVMVNSGSSANLLMIAALKKYWGWRDGDEILVSASGFPTTVSAIICNNLKPVFIDVVMDDLNWNLFDLSKRVTDKTRAIFSSPVLGNPYNVDELKDLCFHKNLVMIGDSCDSLGTKWNSIPLSNYFAVSSFSFYASHHISTGEGGMVVTDNPDIYNTVRSMASWGRGCHCRDVDNMLPNGKCGKRFGPWLDGGGYDGVVDHRYVFDNVGFNVKPLDLQGAIGTVQLEKIGEIISRRRDAKHIIQGMIEKYRRDVRVVNEHPKAFTSWFAIPIICDTIEVKNYLVLVLETAGIQTRNYFSGNILYHPAYRNYGDAVDYPMAKEVLDRVFFIGCSPWYDNEIFQYIEDTLRAIK